MLGLRPSRGLPQEFIWQFISVPPVCIRPSVQQDGASNEDDLTVKLTEIVFTNALIKQGLSKGVSTAQLMVFIFREFVSLRGLNLQQEQWEFLQVSVALYVNSETPGIPLQLVRLLLIHTLLAFFNVS